MKWTLKKKLFLGFSITPVFLLLIEQTGTYLVQDITSRYNSLITDDYGIVQSVDRVNYFMLQARRSEKDFLARNELTYVEKVDTAIAGLQTEANKILEHGRKENDRVLMDSSQTLNDLSGQYSTQFHQLVDAWTRRGLDHESGLQGSFRNAAHELETQLSQNGYNGLEVDYLTLRRNEKDYLLRGTVQYIENTDLKLAEMKEKIGALDLTEENQAKWKELLDRYNENFHALVDEDTRIAQINEQMRETIHQIEPLCLSTKTAVLDNVKTEEYSTQQKAKAVINVLHGVSIFALVTTFLFALFFIRAITRPVVQLTERLKNIAEGEGDLTQQLTVNTSDELNELACYFNKFTEKLRQMIIALAEIAEQVSVGAQQLSSTSQELANATTEQASSLEETSASIEELSGSVEQNSHSAQLANRMAQQTASETEEGSRVVLETLDDMTQIAEKISIINDIADQTNLLALNAAIEAARAGEMGKEFAVVAVEIRKLAERSQAAAKEISDLAGNSVLRAEHAGNAIRKVVPSIQNVSALLESISAACSEQSTGAEQIRLAITQLDTVTQKNSSTSEETASASVMLASQTDMLKELISRFRIDNHQAEKAKPVSGKSQQSSMKKNNGRLFISQPEALKFGRHFHAKKGRKDLSITSSTNAR